MMDEALNFESIWDLKKYSWCFNESLRIEPPVMQSTFCMLTESVQMGKISIRKGDKFSIDIAAMHHNKAEW